MKLSSTKYLLKEGLKNVWSNRMMSFASIGVLVSCLLLTGAALLFSMNISSVMGSVEDSNSTTVYIKQDVATLKAVQMGEKIESVKNVKSIEFIPKEEALKQYEEMLGSLYDGLEGQGVLPDAYRVTMEDLSKYDETVKDIKAIEGVDSVSDRSDTAEKLTDLNRMVTTAGFWIVLILSIVSLFIIANTIRVTMFSRRLEISIMKSVGATNGFIRVPFIVEGVLIGIVSALVSTLVLSLIYDKTLMAIEEIIPFKHIPFSSLAVWVVLCFVAAGVIFGALGGLITIRRYLKRDGGDIIAF